MKKTAAIIIAICAAAAAAFWLWQRETSTVEGDGMRLFGNVEMRQVLMSFRVPGRISSLAFEEGDRVAEGALVATLDDAQYAITVREATAAASAAEATLDKLRKGYEDDDIRAARAARDQVAANLRNAETNFRRFSDLYKQNVIAQKEYDDAATARDQLRAALSAADSKLHQLSGGFRTEDVRAAEAQVEIGRARVDAAETALADTRLYAPAAGRLLTRVAEPGTMVGAGTPVCALQLSSPIFVRAYVSEKKLARVRVGMKGRISVDAYPGETIEGTVSFIASEAEFTPKQVQTEDIRADLVYRIRLRVDDDADERLKNGMPVTVELIEQ